MSDQTEELIKNIFDLGEYSFAEIEFGEWEVAEEGVSFWDVLLHLKSSDVRINVGQCWLEDEEVSFYVDMDGLMEIVIKEVGKKTEDYLLKEFGSTINSKLNVQIYGRDYT